MNFLGIFTVTRHILSIFDDVVDVFDFVARDVGFEKFNLHKVDRVGFEPTTSAM